MVKTIILSFISTIVLIILITITIKLVSISNSSLTYSDIESLIDTVIETGIGMRAIDKDDPLIKKRQIVISSKINENLANEVVSKLLYLDSINNDSIYVIISTMGGYGNCAKQIVETFDLIKSPVNTIAAGACYSSGSVISVSGTGRRYATKNTVFMLHANLSHEKDNEPYVNYYNNWYEGVWKSNAEVPAAWYPMTRDKEYYFNAEEAVKYKVIDEIITRLN